MPKKFTLTTRQWEIVRLMKAGWKMRQSRTIDGETWLSRRGEIKDVNLNSFFSLSEKGVVERRESGFPSSLWGLTEFGESLEVEDE